MKKIKLLFSSLSILCLSITSVLAQNISLPPSGGNQKASISQWMGPVEVNITYNSPDVTGPDGTSREGKIWGELVPYGMNNLGFGTAEAAPWRAGANENTVFTVSNDVTIGGKELKAGTYGLHMIVEEGSEWTVIFSKNSTAWGSYFYNEKDDALRIKAKVAEAPFTEYLTYGFDNRELDACTAYLQWENKKASFDISVPAINELYLSEIRNELQNSSGFNYLSWVQAANFCVQNDVNLEEALTWADYAISGPFVGQKNFNTLQAKANVLKKLDRNDEAEVIMAEAIEHPTASVQEIHVYGRTLLAEEKPGKALEIFMLNRKKHPEDNFTTNVGLARGYEAMGENKKAIKHWEAALENIPDSQKPNLPYYENEIKKLKEEN
ncbi:DUF2911 domain-containing protein [Chondrinema litorale]|uniref:DUF2911 domain-containing protein n=1 Tax=Chondrinema litorale TaxID=2994555 RepID=UPI002543848C|nr:DUF2911 domain-containing protein [Chondrinema litorale]UZR93800.1 DUF2911 domain-containing protein [Chondrinema litorale]